MFLWHFLLVIILALIITNLLVGSGRRFGPGEGILSFFFMILLFAWAGGLWITPFGPVLMGTYWMPFVVMGLLFALLLAAVIPPREQPSVKISDEESMNAYVASVAVLSIFFWIFIIILISAIIVAYL